MSTPSPFDLPVIMTAAGAQPTPPATLLAQLLAAATTASPGLTVLPGILIEDISSTDVAALALIDSARVELLNDISPNTANLFLLTQLGQVYGIYLGSVTNTSIVLVFSGTVGYVIPNGFLVSDGTYTYQVQTGGVILSGGSSGGITAIATTAGIFGVNANTVTTIQTSVPASVSLTVTNPSPGTPGTGAESYSSFQARVFQAGLAASVGTGRFLKTLLGQVPGVTTPNVGVQQVSGGGIRVIASGGDAYAIAYAILSSVADPTELQGSAISSGRNVTVSLIDGADTYTVLYVNTQVQTVTVTATWNTTLANFTGGSAFPGLVQGPIAAYINALAPGQGINVLEMNALFQAAVAPVLNPVYVTRLVFAVYINSTLTAPTSGTYIIPGDPESNFNVLLPAITVLQG
jgi:Baseplate J-like protein